MAELNIKDYLPLVSRPGRYIGGEINSVKKDLSKVDLSIGLAFPDVYEIGMSHLGIQILYQLLNKREDIACERVFAPWGDMERLLREKRSALATLESGIPLHQLDVLGFSIHYELSYTNILNMLDLGNIPLRSKDRDENHPLIIGGGPLAFNPEPIADFFDLFVVGDGEEAVLEIADILTEWKRASVRRDDLLKRLARVEGVYVPSFFDVAYKKDGTVEKIVPLLKGYERVRKRLVPDINALPVLGKPVVPFPHIVHDHVSIEINRGCTRGCRFCQAGIIYRPNRERSPENILRTIDEALKSTGHDEVSLLSLSAGDHSCVQDILVECMDRFSHKKVAIAFPSLRVGTLKPRIVEEIKRVRKTGFTMAPEAGSERLRRVINKEIEEHALIETARHVFAAGWRAIKLYSMIGLPTETMDDIRGIVELSGRVLRAGKGNGFRPVVTVSVSQFIPKPHTPFQWEAQITLHECLERQTFLRKELAGKGLDFKWHDARMSFLEGVFARGDRRLSRAIQEAFKQGCRFDSWGDQFQFQVWERVFKETDVNPEFYAYRRREKKEVLPWSHIDTGVKAEFLYQEYEKAIRQEITPDCKTDACGDCGVCDHKMIKNITFSDKCLNQRTEAKPSSALNRQPSPFKIRFTFSKTGSMKYLGHLELVTLFSRAFRRGDIPIAYSSGFHPLPKLSFGPPLPVGIESIAEHVDVELTEYRNPEEISGILNSALPEGIKILEGKELPGKTHPLASSEATYLVFLGNSLVPAAGDSSFAYAQSSKEKYNGEGLQYLINDLLAKEEIVITQDRDGKERRVNMRPLIKRLSVFDETALQLTLTKGEAGSVKPHEVIACLLGISHNDSRLVPVLKIKEGV